MTANTRTFDANHIKIDINSCNTTPITLHFLQAVLEIYKS